MNDEFLWWFLILVAVGVGVVAYLALGPVPEIAAAGAGELGPPADGTAAEEEPGTPGVAAAQSSPVSTTEPGPAAPASTSDTP